jgi:mycofactocin precursor
MEQQSLGTEHSTFGNPVDDAGPESGDVVEEFLVEDVSIDGMCGVY